MTHEHHCPGPVLNYPLSYRVDPRLLELKRMVLDSVVSANSKRNYAQALDGLFFFRCGPVAHASAPDGVEGDNESAGAFDDQCAPLGAAQNGVPSQKDGMLGAEEAANRNGYPQHSSAGNSLGNWLTKEQARELLMVPARNTLKGKRDYVTWRS